MRQQYYDYAPTPQETELLREMIHLASKSPGGFCNMSHAPMKVLVSMMVKRFIVPRPVYRLESIEPEIDFDFYKVTEHGKHSAELTNKGET